MDTDQPLGEQSDLMPFFQQNEQAAAALGKLGPLSAPDLLSFEYSILGDYRADIVVGDSKESAFVFIELGNAEENSIFRDEGRKVSHWAPRFSKGVHQLVDWFHALGHTSSDAVLRNELGHPLPDLMPMLIIGRRSLLSRSEVERLRWYRQHVLVNGEKIFALTFDDVLRKLQREISFEILE